MAQATFHPEDPRLKRLTGEYVPTEGSDIPTEVSPPPNTNTPEAEREIHKKKAPGEGQPKPAPNTTYIVGASEYGGPGDPTSGTHGSCGGSLVNRSAIAELGMGTLLGGLSCGTRVQIEPFAGKVKAIEEQGNTVQERAQKGRSVIAEKLDIGLGGAPVNGHARRVDIWYQTAREMGLPGNGKWTGLITIKRVDGKAIIGPNDKISESKAEEAGIGSGLNPLEWGKELGKILSFLGSSAGWFRIGKVLIGAILILFAIFALTKIGAGGEINLPKPRRTI